MCIGKSDADRTTPLIAAQQAGVNALIGGTKAALSPADAQKILTERPDVMAEYQRASAAADPNSPVFKQKGLDSPENYAAYWYTQMGGNKEFAVGGEANQGPTPEQTQADLLTSLTQGFQDTITQLQNESRTQLEGLAQMNQGLVGQIGEMQAKFGQSQAELLDEMNKASKEQSEAMSKALKELINAQNRTGQKAKAPNFAKALAKNRDLNSGGLSSTMLTGPTGVSPGAMSLGATSLLGA